MLTRTRNTRRLPQQTTRVLLCTYATQPPIGASARSLRVGTPAQVYTLLTAGSPTNVRFGNYTTVHARALYTWAHPPTCAPYTAFRLMTSARAPVVILHSPRTRLDASAPHDINTGIPSIASYGVKPVASSTTVLYWKHRGQRVNPIPRFRCP